MHSIQNRISIDFNSLERNYECNDKFDFFLKHIFLFSSLIDVSSFGLHSVLIGTDY